MYYTKHEWHLHTIHVYIGTYNTCAFVWLEQACNCRYNMWALKGHRFLTKPTLLRSGETWCSCPDMSRFLSFSAPGSRVAANFGSWMQLVVGSWLLEVGRWVVVLLSFLYISSIITTIMSSKSSSSGSCSGSGSGSSSSSSSGSCSGSGSSSISISSSNSSSSSSCCCCCCCCYVYVLFCWELTYKTRLFFWNDRTVLLSMEEILQHLDA